MATAVGIMGFGRIARNVFKILQDDPSLEVRAIADPAEPEALAYLLKFDTVHGRFEAPVELAGESLYVSGRPVAMWRAHEPADVDWNAAGVEIVIDATGRSRHRRELEPHLERGARRVILTAPAEDEMDATVVMGVNDRDLPESCRIVSASSCTTNAIAPVCKVLDEAFGIERGFLTTIHAYSGSQCLADVAGSGPRASRSAAENTIPSETRAPRSVGEVLPNLAGRLDGLALSVPVPDGSCVDLVCATRKSASAEEVNSVIRSAAATRLRGIVEYTEDPIVSSDVVGNPHSGVFDGLSSQVLGDNLIKTVTWHDVGWGYARRVCELLGRMAKWEA